MWCAVHLLLPSFPTRRSSDLLLSLNGGGSAGGRRHPGFTVAASLGAAACYALFDVLVRKWAPAWGDRKSTRLNSSHLVISYAVFCLKKKTNQKYSLIITQAEE